MMAIICHFRVLGYPVPMHAPVDKCEKSAAFSGFDSVRIPLRFRGFLSVTVNEMKKVLQPLLSDGNDA